MKTYMVVERFRPGCLTAAYQRFEEQGRLLPEGLLYVDSWLDPDAGICFQLMRTEDADLFPLWFGRWDDLVEFDLHPLR